MMLLLFLLLERIEKFSEYPHRLGIQGFHIDCELAQIEFALARFNLRNERLGLAQVRRKFHLAQALPFSETFEYLTEGFPFGRIKRLGQAFSQWEPLINPSEKYPLKGYVLRSRFVKKLLSNLFRIGYSRVTFLEYGL